MPPVYSLLELRTLPNELLTCITHFESSLQFHSNASSISPSLSSSSMSLGTRWWPEEEWNGTCPFGTLRLLLCVGVAFRRPEKRNTTIKNTLGSVLWAIISYRTLTCTDRLSSFGHLLEVLAKHVDNRHCFSARLAQLLTGVLEGLNLYLQHTAETRELLNGRQSVSTED